MLKHSSVFNQQLRKFFSWNHSCTKTFQMLCINLAIDQHHVFLLQLMNIIYESKFACIVYQTEHAFAKKNISQARTINAADQFIVQPNFSAVRKSFFM